VKALFKGILDKAKAPSLREYIAGRFYNTNAPQKEKMPYIVFMLVSDTPEDTFDTSMEDTIVQLSIFDDNRSPENVCDIFELVNTCFDYVTLTIVGYTTVEMRRGVANLMRDPDDDAWHYQVDYRVRIQEV